MSSTGESCLLRVALSRAAPGLRHGGPGARTRPRSSGWRRGGSGRGCGGRRGGARRGGAAARDAETSPGTGTEGRFEAWATQWNGSGLVSEPLTGPLRPAPWTAAWGATSAPWIFVVDGTGIVRAKFAGIVGTDEVRAAIRAVAGWAPTW